MKPEIDAYLKRIEKRICFLKELHKEHKEEALTLCCCYIDAFASKEYSESDETAVNFCSMLEKYFQPELCTIHPKQLKDILSNNGDFDECFSSYAEILDDLSETCSKEDMVSKLSHLTNNKQEQWLTNYMYKGSIAYIAYKRIRCGLVHNMSGPEIEFDKIRFNGNPIPRLGFNTFYKALTKMFEDYKNKSISQNEFI